MYNKILFVPKIGGQNVDEAHRTIRCATLLLEEYQAEEEFGHLFKQLEIIESWDQVDDKTVVVPVGGDGTVLYAAKLALEYNVPLIGVNLGQIGFLTDLPADERQFHRLFLSLIDKGNEKFKKDRRTLLSVKFNDQEYVAMNDFVISDLYSDAIINYDMSFGRSYAGRHRANSVMVATPTGSTAYALMVGGSIIEPDLNVMEVIPVAPLTMASRPIICSGNSEVTINVHNKKGREISLKGDGQEIARFRGDDIQITLKKYERQVTLLHFETWNYFEKLTLKLGWNK